MHLLVGSKNTPPSDQVSQKPRNPNNSAEQFSELGRQRGGEVVVQTLPNSIKAASAGNVPMKQARRIPLHSFSYMFPWPHRWLPCYHS